MSTQDGFTVPLEISTEQQNFRLLELPPALLELIVSKNPHSLSLKSMKLDSQDGATSTQHNAVLCTNDQTFNVRQVNSSNSVFLTEPIQSNLGSQRSSLYNTGVQAIAQCAATLELIPASVDGTSILKQLLPTYNFVTDDVEHNKNLNHESKSYERFSKEALFENIPLSRHQFDDAWRNTCAFELDGVALLPSAIHLARIWKSITSAATRNGLNLAKSFCLMDLTETVDEDDFPRDLLNAVITRVVMDNKDAMENKKNSQEYPVETIDRDECVSWIGGVFLEAHSLSGNGCLELDFLHDWQNQLPEKWRGDAKLGALKCKYSRQSNGTVEFEPNNRDSSQPSMAPNAGGKRLGKWHEKFKNTRR